MSINGWRDAVDYLQQFKVLQLRKQKREDEKIKIISNGTVRYENAILHSSSNVAYSQIERWLTSCFCTTIYAGAAIKTMKKH